MKCSYISLNDASTVKLVMPTNIQRDSMRDPLGMHCRMIFTILSSAVTPATVHAAVQYTAAA